MIIYPITNIHNLCGPYTPRPGIWPISGSRVLFGTPRPEITRFPRPRNQKGDLMGPPLKELDESYKLEKLILYIWDVVSSLTQMHCRSRSIHKPSPLSMNDTA